MTSLAKIVTNVASLSLKDSNSAIIQALETDSDILQRLADDFSRIIATRKVTIYSFAEELSMAPFNGVGRVRSDFPAIQTHPDTGIIIRWLILIQH